MTAGAGHRGWARFRRNRSACGGLVVLLLIGGVAAAGLPFSSRWFNVQDLDNAVRLGPMGEPVTPYAVYAGESADAGGGSAESPGSSIARFVHRTTGWMGYDALGRSLWLRVLLGWVISLAIGLGAALTAVTIGVLWGAGAAMAGGRVDALMMRVVDVLYGLPYVLFVILLKVVLEPPLARRLGGDGRTANVVIVFVAIGAVSWLTMARVIRGQVLSLRSQPFIQAARACGVGPVRMLWRHLLPNLAGPVVVYATLVIPQAILQESFLSFLGIGVQSPIPSLGLLAADGVESVNTFVGFWWLIAFPCGILLITLLALNFVGDGLRDALDPTTRAAIAL